MPPSKQPEQQQQRALSQQLRAAHGLQAASAHAEETGDKEIQQFTHQLIHSLQEMYSLPKPRL
jgi:hypothetical protein